MAQLTTDKRLLRALLKAAEKPMTAKQRRMQKISFIMGSLDKDSSITRQQVEEQLRRQEGEAA
jgi:hypothetical protein